MLIIETGLNIKISINKFAQEDIFNNLEEDIFNNLEGL